MYKSQNIAKDRPECFVKLVFKLEISNYKVTRKAQEIRN